MSVTRTILMHMFGRPQGVLGRLGGIIMGRMNAAFGIWVSNLLEVGPNDSVLEIGFGPGVVLQCLLKPATAGHGAGMDPERERKGKGEGKGEAAGGGGAVTQNKI